MREIKFRGINNETGEFVYGWYTRLQEGARKFDAVVTDEDGTLTRYYIHERNTIGQFTGLYDKNGVEIYEGDIVQIEEDDEDSCCGNTFTRIAIVSWGNSKEYSQYISQYPCCFCLICKDFYKEQGLFLSRYELEVIGNIHQNPELLEEK